MTTTLFSDDGTATITAGGTDAPSQGTSESWTATGSTLPSAATGTSQAYISDPAQPTEVMLITNTSGGTLTVTRGADGTTPVVHSNPFTVYNVVPSGILTPLGAVGSANGLASLDSGGHVPTGQIPQLSQYNPIGLTGATTPTSYAGGTVSGQPLSGTWTQGQWVVDETGKIYVCVTGGTPGTWRRVGANPWQFFVDDYGAKGNGAFLYDANMTGTNAVLTTAGLPAPSAPTLSNAGSGGSLTAGTYQVKITYVNQYGETLASTATSQAISGTQSLTISSPLPWTNATGYYAYVTQAGGSSFTRQQTLGSPTPLRTSYVLTANPSSSGAQPPGSNTSASAPFTSGDVGKAIIVLSAGGFLNVPLVTTITSFQSSSQVTLTAASTSAVTGYGAVYGTDDTAAIQTCINSAVAYAQTAGTEQATAEVVFSNKIYCIAGALAGTYQNAQIQIPFVDPYAGPKVNLRLIGPSESAGPVHWEQPNPPATGCTLASIYYSDSGSPPTPPPVVIGGPVENAAAGVFFGGDVGLFSNMRIIVDGINVLVAYRPSICGLDLYGVAQADIKSFSYFGMARTATAAGGWPAYTGGAANPAPWQVFGYRGPYTGNNAQNDLDRLTVYGAWYGCLFTDHFHAQSIRCIYTKAAAVSVSNSGSHHAYIGTLVSEVTDYPLYCPVDGVYGGPATQPLTIAAMQSENAVTIIEDTGNNLYGEVHAENAGLTGAFSGGKAGAANIKLVWDFQPLGHVGSPPAVPSSGTAQINDFWQPATVTIHTGAGVTVSAIALDGTATGQTVAASSSLTIPVRNGGTITLTYSGGTPTWDWWLG